MKISIRYLDKFSARAGNHNWISDSGTYHSEKEIIKRLDELQDMGYLVELTFTENLLNKEVDLEGDF